MNKPGGNKQLFSLRKKARRKLLLGACFCRKESPQLSAKDGLELATSWDVPLKVGDSMSIGALLPLKPSLCQQELELLCKKKNKRQAGVSQRELIRASGLQLNEEINRCFKMPSVYPGQDEKRGALSVKSGSNTCKVEVVLMFGRVPSTLDEVCFFLGDSHHLQPPSSSPACRIPVSKLSAPLHKGRRWLSLLRPC